MVLATPAHYHLPDPLNIKGSDIADNWRRFIVQWENYIVAANLMDATPEKRAAVFLTCIGSDAYDVYHVMHFEFVEDSKKIDNILEGFQVFCIRAVNETYGRYRFKRRIQDVGERFDLFLGAL